MSSKVRTDGSVSSIDGEELNDRSIDRLAGRIEKMTLSMEKMNLAEYTTLLQNPWRLAWVNLIAGSARGLGIGFGFAVLTALLLYIAQGLMMANLPVIGDFIATIVRLVEQDLRP